jgi:hypothetical protein
MRSASRVKRWVEKEMRVQKCVTRPLPKIVIIVKCLAFGRRNPLGTRLSRNNKRLNDRLKMGRGEVPSGDAKGTLCRWHAANRKRLAERRYDRMATKAFEQACKGNSGEALHEAADLLNRGGDAWRLAMMKVARLSAAGTADILPVPVTAGSSRSDAIVSL